MPRFCVSHGIPQLHKFSSVPDDQWRGTRTPGGKQSDTCWECQKRECVIVYHLKGRKALYLWKKISVNVYEEIATFVSMLFKVGAFMMLSTPDARVIVCPGSTEVDSQLIPDL
ncbi:hypothetical protein CEXT_4081 [Caerostris extrusa]|uniref:Uncharacterized protein n=1 Tax=Caerostris extrusa TaxID=172846 RepID=A0AAV4UR53_CAEEX|nr:hypothetical protein CEXT_4081 [Caerostris extrusa]